VTEHRGIVALSFFFSSTMTDRRRESRPCLLARLTLDRLVPYLWLGL